MARADTSYEHKDIIINLYNTSVSHFNASCLGHPDDASNQEDLNVAGERLYCCFEAAVKHVLVNYWRDQYQRGIIPYTAFNRPGKNSTANKQVIEAGKRPGLVAQLQQLLNNGEIKPLCSMLVDYSTIEKTHTKSQMLV